MTSFPSALPLAAATLAVNLLLGGCATVSDSDQQQLEVHTILEHREVAGVGCLLANDLGRWFVTAPGRVTVTRSTKPIAVYCKRDGVGSADEWWASRYDTNRLIGNVAISAGLGYFVDRHSGAGFSYPDTLTVYLHPASGKAGEGQPAEPGTPIF